MAACPSLSSRNSGSAAPRARVRGLRLLRHAHDANYYYITSFFFFFSFPLHSHHPSRGFVPCSPTFPFDTSPAPNPRSLLRSSTPYSPAIALYASFPLPGSSLSHQPYILFWRVPPPLPVRRVRPAPTHSTIFFMRAFPSRPALTIFLTRR